MHDLLMIDGLQYSNWNEEIFRQMQSGGLSAVHATIAYHENARETLSRIGEWNRRFETWPELIRPVREAADIRLAHQEGRVGIFFGFQNCSPIEDDISLVEVFRQLGVLIMQLTYNNQSLLASGCYESEDNGISRFGRQVIREMNRVGMLIDMSPSAEPSTATTAASSSSARKMVRRRMPTKRITAASMRRSSTLSSMMQSRKMALAATEMTAMARWKRLMTRKVCEEPDAISRDP